MARHSYRENGRFATYPRGPGGLVHVTFDAREVIQLTNRLKGEAAKLTQASKAAHTELAKELQNDIAQVLRQKVEGRGRAQKTDKPAESRLGNAIRSAENRRVAVDGYTVGYLDEIAAVAPYYRNLEEGTDVFVGRYLSGVFSTPGTEIARGPRGGVTPTMRRGRPGRGIPGSAKIERRAIGQDARFFQRAPFRRDQPYFPGVKIKHAIQGYHYIAQGNRRFLARGGGGKLALEKYVAAFDAQGINLLTRALNATRSGGLPSINRFVSQKP